MDQTSVEFLPWRSRAFVLEINKERVLWTVLRFLVAADITAFAAGAEGGEHSQRVERALLFAPLGSLKSRDGVGCTAV